MKIKSLLLTAALAIPTIASAQAPTPPTTQAPTKNDTAKTDTKTDSKTAGKLSSDEQMMVAHIHHVNLMEIQMGKMAKQRGTQAVRKFADTLIQDHSASDKELKAMAKKKGLAKIPADKPQTEVEKQDMKMMMDSMAAMKKLKGADFDREFLRMNAEGHEKELAKTDVWLTSAQDPELKTMLEARKTTLRRHADMAKELQQGNAQASATPPPAAKSTK